MHKSCAQPGRGYELLFASYMDVVGPAEHACTIRRSSFSEARDKLHWEAFAYLLDEVSLEEDPSLPRWKGHRVRAVDGTFLQLPSSPEILSKFPIRRGGWGEPHYPAARLFVAANLFTQQVTHARVSNKHDHENRLLLEFITQFSPGDLAILDRGMGGKNIWAVFDQAKQHYLSRLKVCKANFFDRHKKDQLVTLRVDNESIQVRVVRGPKLKTGQYIFLATNLIERKKYPHAELLKLYKQRQAVEDVFLNLKTNQNVKSINAKKINGVLQEIFAALTMTSLAQGIRFIFEQNVAERRVSFKALVWRISTKFFIFQRASLRFTQSLSSMIGFGHVRQPGRSYPRFSKQPANKWYIEGRRKLARARKRSKTP